MGSNQILLQLTACIVSYCNEINVMHISIWTSLYTGLLKLIGFDDVVSQSSKSSVDTIDNCMCTRDS